jgi:hypothetical protein
MSIQASRVQASAALGFQVANWSHRFRRFSSAANAEIIRIVERSARYAGGYPTPTDVDLKCTFFDPFLIEGLVCLEHRKPYGTTEGKAIRSGANVAHRYAIAVHHLGMKQQRLAVFQEDLKQLPVR